MIEFKKVCENFNLAFNNARQPTREIFLNTHLEIVRDPSQEASFEEILSALQQRIWIDSTHATEELDIEKNIKRIWCQTKFIYQESLSETPRSLQTLYQQSVFEKVFFNSSKLHEYASKIISNCEALSIYKCISSIKKNLSQPTRELVKPTLENFNQQLEKKYQQATALLATDEFQILTCWKQNDIQKFFSVFIEEKDGSMEQSFPELLKIYQVAHNLLLKKYKSNNPAHSYKHTSKKIRKVITPNELRKRLLKTIQKPFNPIDIAVLDKLKFVLFKNPEPMTGKEFREYYQLLKKLNRCVDEIETLRQFLHNRQTKIDNLMRRAQNSLFHSLGVPALLSREKSIAEAQIIERILAKRNLIKEHFFSLPLLMEFALIKIRESYFFDRNLERSVLESFVKSVPDSEFNMENSEVFYENLLRELDKIKSTYPPEKQHELYTLSDDIKAFFKLMQKDRTHLLTLPEYKELDIPVLESIFTKEDTQLIEEALGKIQLNEDRYYEETITSMFQSLLELRQEEKSVAEPFQKKNEIHTGVRSPKTLYSLVTKTWQEVIPITSRNTVKLVYPTHVTRWFENPNDSLNDPKYTAIIKKLGRNACLYFHTFPKIIDNFVGTEYSLQNEVYNDRTEQSDVLYGIPGEIEFKEQKYRGFFQYIIDSKSGVCYHRCFNHRSKNFIEDIVEEKIWRPNDFPTLDQSKDYSTQKMESFIDEESILQYDSVLQKIYVKTEAMKICLFKGFDTNLMHEFLEFIESPKKGSQG